MQHTLKTPVSCSGVGLHSGTPVTLTLQPAVAGQGIRFVRTDITDRDNVVEARWDRVVNTQLCTVISNDAGVTVSTIEHLLSALAGCGVDNATILIDGPEVPIMDGSAEPFVFLIECSGLKGQHAPRRAVRVLKEVSYEEGDKRAVLKPGAGTTFSFEIDFDNAAIGRQAQSFRLVNGTFKSQISRARTFGFLREVEWMRKNGLAQGGSLDNAIVIDGDKVLNPGGLRFGDEFVRHKILDAIGDLFLAGGHLLGHFEGQRAGHALNNKILHVLFSDPTAYEIVEIGTGIRGEKQNLPYVPLRGLPQGIEVAG